MGTERDLAYIGIDPDTPIYHIIKLRHLEALLSGRLRLQAPSAWDDPFEFLMSRVQVTVKERRPWQLFMLADYLRPVYAQCWSATQESDTLWRAYSRVARDPKTQLNCLRDDEGVQLRSTPRSLIESVRQSPSWAPGVSSFVGRVVYMDEDAIQQDIADRIGTCGLNAFSKAPDLAAATLRKRHAFDHEKEVRLIHVETDPGATAAAAIEMSVDPTTLIEEISFDPRLASGERMQRQSHVQQHGYTGRFREPILYQGVLCDIVLSRLPAGSNP